MPDDAATILAQAAPAAAPEPVPAELDVDEAALDASSSTAPAAASVTRTNSLSKMRSHRGNIPTLPQTKLCHLCPAKFTRTTHLNRHLKTRKSGSVPARCRIESSRLTRRPQIRTRGSTHATYVHSFAVVLLCAVVLKRMLQRCHAQFTRSDLLTRHKRTCCDS